ncbi:hypothetical protein NQ314_012958 [Rhamnusium bicolor]|uniref:Uncharacterized protein n=1 Tax=Rhamnusium bicolor TaxID=1586634 RepID=A0AAV8X9B8_9CUCU|nr:hypothetical protein NQ314_012958 [Rhamnusium bicolor]
MILVCIDRQKANGTARNIFTPTSISMKSLGELPKDTCFEVTPPKVSQKSIDIYKKYINVGINGGYDPKPSDMAIYKKYASFK